VTACFLTPVGAVLECKETALGTEYYGKISKTVSGLTCQDWASQIPHSHQVFTNLPDGSEEEAKNFCRNPDNSPKGPWCYTSDEDVLWEYCDVKFCGAACVMDLCTKYNVDLLQNELQAVKKNFEQFKQAVYEQFPLLVCPAGFEYSAEVKRCYKVIPERLDWNDAREKCSSLSPGAHLSVTRNKFEDEVIRAYLNRWKNSNSNEDFSKCIINSNSAYIFTSGQRIDKKSCESSFVWKPTDTVALALNYTNWYSQSVGGPEPNCYNGRLEDCLTYSSLINFNWADITCKEAWCSLCEVTPLSSETI